MNIILALMLLAGCTALGYRKTERLRKRKKTLLSMQADIRRLSERMALYPEPFSKMLSRIDPVTDEFWLIFQSALCADEAVGILFEKAMHEASEQKNGFELLSDEETAILRDFGSMLHVPELASQQENALLAVSRLGAAAEALETQIKQKGRLFESLGLLSGLALALLVI